MKIDDPARLSASEFVAETLRREILRGDLLPGQPLLQDHIAARFEVSQSSVREAMRRLEALALVTSIRNRGAFVSTLTAAQVEEMYDIRLAIELLALRHRLTNISSEELAEADRLIKTLESEPGGGFLGEAHKKFHETFYNSPERKLAKDVLQNIYGNVTRLWVDFIKRKPSVARQYEEQSRREHRELLSAVKLRNLDKAEAVLTRHIDRARDLLVAHLRQLEAEPARETSLSAVSPVARSPKSRRPRRTLRAKTAESS